MPHSSKTRQLDTLQGYKHKATGAHWIRERWNNKIFQGAHVVKCKKPKWCNSYRVYECSLL